MYFIVDKSVDKFCCGNCNMSCEYWWVHLMWYHQYVCVYGIPFFCMISKIIKLVSSQDTRFNVVTNFTDRSVSSESGQEFCRLISNSKVNYHVHMKPPLVTNVTQINVVHPSTPYNLEINFNIILSISSFAKWSLPFFFYNQNFVFIFHVPCHQYSVTISFFYFVKRENY